MTKKFVCLQSAGFQTKNCSSTVGAIVLWCYISYRRRRSLSSTVSPRWWRPCLPASTPTSSWAAPTADKSCCGTTGTTSGHPSSGPPSQQGQEKFNKRLGFRSLCRSRPKKWRLRITGFNWVLVPVLMMPVFNQCTDYPFCSAHTHPVYCAKVVGTQNAHNLITISTDGKERIKLSYGLWTAFQSWARDNTAATG